MFMINVCLHVDLLVQLYIVIRLFIFYFYFGIQSIYSVFKLLFMADLLNIYFYIYMLGITSGIFFGAQFATVEIVPLV